MAQNLSINALPQNIIQNENSLSSSHAAGKENSLSQANKSSVRAFGLELTNFQKSDISSNEANKPYVNKYPLQP